MSPFGEAYPIQGKREKPHGTVGNDLAQQRKETGQCLQVSTASVLRESEKV